VHEKARAETLAADARQALGQDTPIDRLRSLALELQQVYQGLLSTAGTAQPPPQDQQAGTPGGEGDDVIDAEFTAHE
jgi:molecular chaperone DnaK